MSSEPLHLPRTEQVHTNRLWNMKLSKRVKLFKYLVYFYVVVLFVSISFFFFVVKPLDMEYLKPDFFFLPRLLSYWVQMSIWSRVLQKSIMAGTYTETEGKNTTKLNKTLFAGEKKVCFDSVKYHVRSRHI